MHFRSEWVGGAAQRGVKLKEKKTDHMKIDSELVLVVVVELGKTQCLNNKVNNILLKKCY